MNTEDLGKVSDELEKELNKIEIQEDNKTINDDVTQEHNQEESSTTEENTDYAKGNEHLHIEESLKNYEYPEYEENLIDSSIISGESNKDENINENIDENIDDTTNVNNKGKYNWKSLPLWAKISSIVFLILLIFGISIMIYVRSLVGKINYENPDDVIHYEEPTDIFEIETETEIESQPEETTEVASEPFVEEKFGPRYEEGVVNILLVGEDRKVETSGRGPSDVIIIATINRPQKSLKLTSIMRDSYVSIPGYRANKINAAYSIGGAPLLAETIEQNFDIRIDGYAYVYNASFEALINKLGGVNITLSSSEASYLNRTNYISNRAYRNVREGYQSLNGNQALGYARIRYIGNSDFDRTNRHKKVLIAIFEKYKTAGLSKSLDTLNYILPQITSNMTADEILNYATSVVMLGATDIETFRIPVDDGYEDTKIGILSVLIPDIKLNTTELHKFIFGDEDIEEATEETTQETIEVLTN